MKQYFKDIPYSHQFILLVVLILSSWVFLTLLGGIIAVPIWGIETLSNPQSLLNNRAFLKYFQIIQSFALFIIPALLFEYLTYNSPFNARRKYSQFYLMIFASILIIVVAQPFISLTGIINNNLSLPESLIDLEVWMRDKENSAAKTTEIFLSSSHWSESLLNILIIAILPAIGEELLFRRSVQRILTGIFKRKHLAIFISAALFSAIHIQFFGFLPRFILGVIFGYLMMYSKNIWLPITAHFTNNFMAYIIYQHYINDINNESNPLQAGEKHPETFWIIISFVGIIVLIYGIKRFVISHYKTLSS